MYLNNWIYFMTSEQRKMLTFTLTVFCWWQIWGQFYNLQYSEQRRGGLSTVLRPARTRPVGLFLPHVEQNSESDVNFSSLPMACLFLFWMTSFSMCVIWLVEVTNVKLAAYLSFIISFFFFLNHFIRLFIVKEYPSTSVHFWRYLSICFNNPTQYAHLMRLSSTGVCVWWWWTDLR